MTRRVTNYFAFKRLKRGDVVDFFPDFKVRAWQTQTVFYDRPNFCMEFIAPAARGDNIYRLIIHNGNLIPTLSGAIEIRNAENVVYSTIEPTDQEHESLRELLRNKGVLQ